MTTATTTEQNTATKGGNMNKRVYNFSAGPSVLPESVLEEVQANLLNYKGNGMSVMEMSHRSKPYQEIIDTAEANLRKIYGISDDYAVLFLQGGASLQFTMIPANLAQEGKSVDYINTGAWAKKAVKEAKRLTNVNIVASSEDKNFSYFPDLSQASFDPNASYVHVTSNNTIFGTQIQEFPKTGDVPLVADMSSDILSREINVNDFGLIYAGAQKNMGPAGVTVVIIRKDLAERCSTDVATMLQYRTHISKGSMFNTPTTFGIYVIGEVLKWIDNQGGLKVVEEINNKKAALLYNEIDSNDFNNNNSNN